MAQAMQREMRRQAAEADAEVLRAHRDPDDLDGLVAWTAERADAKG